jgi:hypothetical protein
MNANCDDWNVEADILYDICKKNCMYLVSIEPQTAAHGLSW